MEVFMATKSSPGKTHGGENGPSCVVCNAEQMKEHYRILLARRYSWIYGGFEEKAAENAELFASLGVAPAHSGTAIDLGCGSGFQAVPLARAGFRVHAVDLSHELLDELATHTAGLPIEIHEQDLSGFMSSFNGRAELIVCMGDTLPHLESPEKVIDLIRMCAGKTEPGGTLILAFRDYTVPLIGDDRFIHVRSDDNTIFTCFVEYFNGYAEVYDLLHEKNGGKWTRTISHYRKLRLSADMIEKTMHENGYSAERTLAHGMITLTGKI
jgi:SAM-dependent methyltransferase